MIKKILLGFGILLGLITLVVGVSFAMFLWNYDDKHRKVTDTITPVAQRQLKADPQLIMARRKQYVDQYRQLWRVDDYAAVRKKAQGGNPIAQRRLYEIYEHCIDMRTSTTWPMLIRIGQVNKKMADVVKRLQGDYQKFCGPSGAGSEANGKTRAFWLRQSAKRGDLVSEMRVTAGESQGVLAPDKFEDFIRRAVVSGDPAAIMEIGAMLSIVKMPWPDRDIAPAFESDLAGHAWILAACRAGMDCEQGSRVMTRVCLQALNCNWPNYQAFLATEGLAETKHKEVEGLVMLIEQVVLNPARFQ